MPNKLVRMGLICTRLSNFISKYLQTCTEGVAHRNPVLITFEQAPQGGSIRALSDIDLEIWRQELGKWAEKNAVHIDEYAGEVNKRV